MNGMVGVELIRMNWNEPKCRNYKSVKVRDKNKQCATHGYVYLLFTKLSERVIKMMIGQLHIHPMGSHASSHIVFTSCRMYCETVA